MKFKTLTECLQFRYDPKKYIQFLGKLDLDKIVNSNPVSAMDKKQTLEELNETDFKSVLSKNKIHEVLLKKYSLNSVAVGETDFERVLNLLKWLTDNTFYNGAQIFNIPDNSIDILNYSFKKPFKNAINCRMKAIAFADCLVAAGLKAYPVCMLSSDFCECHFTCQVYISELDKWCAFDPSFGCYFTDESGALIDIFEVRDLFLSEKQPVVCGYNFNGTTECFDIYMKLFLHVCISNLSTWQDNSLDRRTGKKWKYKKKFHSKIPR